MEVASQTPDTAKQFLLNKLMEQAQREGVKLSDIERRMFLFSETSGQADFEANEKFDSEYDSDEYERKIASLLKKVYGHDCKSAPEKAAWKDALSALQKEDFYGLVMVDAAGIPRPEAIPPQAIPLFDKRLIVFRGNCRSRHRDSNSAHLRSFSLQLDPPWLATSCANSGLSRNPMVAWWTAEADCFGGTSLAVN